MCFLLLTAATLRQLQRKKTGCNEAPDEDACDDCDKATISQRPKRNNNKRKTAQLLVLSFRVKYSTADNVPKKNKS
jgi:hypothetical protein